MLGSWHGLITALIVPPTNLVLLALAALLLARLRPRAGLTLPALCLVGLFVLSIPAVGQALLVSLEQGLPLQPAPDDKPQAIVVLSGDVDHLRGPGPELDVGALTLQRERAAAALWRRTGLPVLVSGGVLRDTNTPIAAMMAASMRDDFGVPVRWVESHSRTTWENAADSAAILAPLGIRSVYVVTHAWHEKRALLAFRHFGLRPTAAVVQLDAYSSSLVPATIGWTRSYFALHEWVGLAWYWLRVQAGRG